ncbi:MAG: glycoside hydrolase family 3 C-terminal domain-containing protein, partial [Acidimicrobiia bacterium]
MLLTNNGVLPISPEQSIGVVGAFAEQPRFQGSGSSLVKPTRVDDLLSSLQARVGSGIGVQYAPGYDPITGEATASQFAEAVHVAAGVDVVVVVVGLPAMMESEGWDRRDLSLPDAHDQLVEALTAINERVVVVLQNGAPVDLPWANRPAALLEAWLGGQAGGSALADVLMGLTEPGGRLPESFPVAVADLPADSDFARRPTQVLHREGPYIGYRFHDTFDVAPRFAFGHGLGYTTWSYGQIRLEGSGTDLTVIVPISNTGDRRGSAVVQVYVHDVASSLHRPDQELKGFAKVTLDPGESVEVSVVLDHRSFAMWDVASSSWLVEGGDFEIRIGASSRDIRAVVEVEIESSDRVRAVPGPAGPVATDEEMAVLLGGPVPNARPLVPFHRDSTIEDLGETRLGGLVRGLLRYVLARRLATPDDQLRAMAESVAAQAPLRVVAMNAGGPRALRVLDRLIATLNAVRLRGGGTS